MARGLQLNLIMNNTTNQGRNEMKKQTLVQVIRCDANYSIMVNGELTSDRYTLTEAKLVASALQVEIPSLYGKVDIVVRAS